MLTTTVVSKRSINVIFSGGNYELFKDTRENSPKIFDLRIYMRAPGDYNKIIELVTKAYQIRSIKYVVLNIGDKLEIDELNISDTEGVIIPEILVTSESGLETKCLNKITGNFKGILELNVRPYNSLEGNFGSISTAPPRNFIKVKCNELEVKHARQFHMKITDSEIGRLTIVHQRNYNEENQFDVVLERCKINKSVESYLSMERLNRTELECDIKKTIFNINSVGIARMEMDNNNHNVEITADYCECITLNGKSPYRIIRLRNGHSFNDSCTVVYDSKCIFMDRCSYLAKFNLKCTSTDNSFVKMENLTDKEYLQQVEFLLDCEQPLEIDHIIRLKNIVPKRKLISYLSNMELVPSRYITGVSTTTAAAYKKVLRQIIDNKLTEVADYYRDKYIYVQSCIAGDYKLDKELTELLIQLNYNALNVFSFDNPSKKDKDNLEYIQKIYVNKYPGTYYKVDMITTLEQLEYVIKLMPHYGTLNSLLELFNVSKNIKEQYAYKHIDVYSVLMLRGNKKATIKIIETAYTSGTRVEMSGIYTATGIEMQHEMHKYKVEDKYVLIALASTMYPPSNLIEHFINKKLYLSDVFNNYVNKEKVIELLKTIPSVMEQLEKLNDPSIYKIFKIEMPSTIHKYGAVIINTMLLTEYRKIKENKLYNGRVRNMDTIYLDTINEIKAPLNKQSDEYKILKYMEEKTQKGEICGEELKMMDVYIMERSDNQFVYKNDVINEFITKHNNILNSSLSGKIPKAYEGKEYHPNLVYLKLLPRVSKLEWNFARSYMKDNKIKYMGADELTNKYFEYMKKTMPSVAASTKAVPLLCNLSNLFCEEVNIILSNQSLESNQHMYRMNLKELNELTSIEDHELKGNVLRYISQSNHPVSRKYLTVGWVRFNINNEAKSIWINEIQTDMSKILGLYDNGIRNIITNKISYNLVISFQYWVTKHYPGFTIVLPSYTTRKKLLSGLPTPSGYDNPARKLKFTKANYEDTVWMNIKRGTGLVWTWAAPN